MTHFKNHKSTTLLLHGTLTHFGQCNTYFQLSDTVNTEEEPRSGNIERTVVKLDLDGVSKVYVNGLCFLVQNTV